MRSLRRLSCYSVILGKLYALTTVKSPTLDWPPLCVTASGALEFLFYSGCTSSHSGSFTLDRELIRMPRRSAEMKCDYNVVPYTPYDKENWPQAQYVANRPDPAGFSPVPSLPFFVGYLGCSPLGEQSCHKANFCAHTHRCELDKVPRLIRRDHVYFM